MCAFKNLPIGFFDSGIGGISVLKETLRLLPNENYIYLGDNKNVPYGLKSDNEIKTISLSCAKTLFEIGVKCIVVACNTATSVSVREMRRKYKIPIISIEPAVKPAIEQVTSGKILVMATPATLHQDRYHSLIKRLGCKDLVIDLPCPELAGLVEKFIEDDQSVLIYLKGILSKYIHENIKGIVLGCTHYSFIYNEIREIAMQLYQREVDVFDGRFGVARHVFDVLNANNMLNESGCGKIVFIATGNQSEIKRFHSFLDYNL